MSWCGLLVELVAAPLVVHSDGACWALLSGSPPAFLRCKWPCSNCVYLQEELAQLRPGERVERDPPPLPSTASQRSYGQQALGKLLGQQPTTYPISEPPIGTGDSPSSSSSSSGVGSSGSSGPTRKEELCGVWEVLSIDQDGRPFLDRWAALGLG